MAVFTRFSGGFCIRRVCVAPAAPTPLWAVPWPPGHEKRTPTAADAHDLKIVVKLRAVPASKVPFPVEIAWFPDFSRPVPVYPAFLKYVVPVQYSSSTSQSPSRFSCLQLLKLIFFSKSSESSEGFEKKGGEAPLLLCVPFRKLCPVFCAVCLSTVVGIGGFHDVIHMARFSVRYFLFVL